MRNIRKWIGLIVLILPVYKYIMNWREEEKERELKKVGR